MKLNIDGGLTLCLVAAICAGQAMADQAEGRIATGSSPVSAANQSATDRTTAEDDTSEAAEEAETRRGGGGIFINNGPAMRAVALPLSK